ncbi:DNA internalization-related competence protein ComEC/Rec2 [Clostridium sp. D2Q-14]|uniref:DNA internalization-related competence protein ComEC/Rec2 n=1 Tax=Anaeromonas gelatinilytica TaxID=2683194 RepID=UPI00193C0330|nr:DNA internalization-related competence protein ComEC/Rec2 [Anaeromonas gelatinilytica]MBS4534567.1 DNA internalization-related competence protein ComEC/Rec2 [Anaeromonas gelatinilytica]
MKRPFINILIPFVIGIIFFYYIELNILIIILSFFIILGFTLLINNKKIRNIFFYMVIFNFAGLLLYNNLNFSEMNDYYDENVELEVIIKDRISEKEYYTSYNGEINKVFDKSGTIKMSEKTIVKLKDNVRIDYGTTVRGQAYIEQPEVNTNPRLFNYSRYLKTRNIYSIIEFEKGSYKSIGKISLSILEVVKLNVKEYLDVFLESSLEEKNIGIIKGILLGDDTLLKEDNLDEYRQLGIAHILAVSGLHIGIITGFLLFIFRKLNIHYRVSALITVLFVFIYGYIVGYPPSILRASMILSFLMLSRVIYRRPDYVNILAFVALILLIYRPLWIFDVGFQLSFICTLSIIVLTPKINNAIFTDVRFGKFISPLLAVQIGIAPILIYNFNYITVTSLIANLILIPILSYLLILVIFLIGLSIFSFNGAIILMGLINKTLTYFSYIANLVHKYLNIVFYLPSISIINIVIYYFIIYVIVNSKELRRIKFKYKITFLKTFIFLVILNEIILNQSKWNVNFIDVGQGDSALVEIKSKCFFIDTGGTTFGDYDVGENILIPYLLKKGINEIDGVFISHFHDDHVKGLISILKDSKIKVNNIFFNPNNERNNLYKEIVYLAKRKGVNIISVHNKDKLKIYDIAEFSFYVPQQTDFNQENNNSLIISLKLDNNRILFMGDAEKELEDEYIKYNDEKFDIVKLGHHGSNTSTTDEFIDHIEPDRAIISVGKNTFGHPHDETLNKLYDRNISLYRTDEEGCISVVDKFDSYEINTYNNIENQYLIYDLFFFIIFSVTLYMDIRYLKIVESKKEKIHDI